VSGRLRGRSPGLTKPLLGAGGKRKRENPTEVGSVKRNHGRARFDSTGGDKDQVPQK